MTEREYRDWLEYLDPGAYEDWAGGLPDHRRMKGVPGKRSLTQGLAGRSSRRERHSPPGREWDGVRDSGATQRRPNGELVEQVQMKQDFNACLGFVPEDMKFMPSGGGDDLASKAVVADGHSGNAEDHPGRLMTGSGDEHGGASGGLSEYDAPGGGGGTEENDTTIISAPQGMTLGKGQSKTSTKRLRNYHRMWNSINKVVNPSSQSSGEAGYRSYQKNKTTTRRISMGMTIDFQKGGISKGYTFTLYEKEFAFPLPIPGVMLKVFGGGSCTIASSFATDGTMVAYGTLGGTMGGAIEVGVPRIAVAYAELTLGVSGSLNLFLAPVTNWNIQASLRGAATVGIRILNGLFEIPYELGSMEFLTLIRPPDGDWTLQPGPKLVALRDYVGNQGKAFFEWLDADNKAHELALEVRKRHGEDWDVRMQRSLSTSQKAKMIRALNDSWCTGEHERSLVDYVQGTPASSRLALLQEATGKSEWKHILGNLDWGIDQGPQIERLARLLKGLATREDFEHCGWEREWDRA